MYKRKVDWFISGAPAELIEVLEALLDMFLQNTMMSADDRDNVIRTILCGNSLTACKSRVHKSMGNPENTGRPLPLSINIISNAPMVVSQDVFPHPAVAMQEHWMSLFM